MKNKAKAGEDIKTYRVFQGEITEVEESVGNFLINKSAEQSPVEVEEEVDDDKKSDKMDDIFKNSLKSRKAF